MWLSILGFIILAAIAAVAIAALAIAVSKPDAVTVNVSPNPIPTPQTIVVAPKVTEITGTLKWDGSYSGASLFGSSVTSAYYARIEGDTVTLMFDRLVRIAVATAAMTSSNALDSRLIPETKVILPMPTVLYDAMVAVSPLPFYDTSTGIIIIETSGRVMIMPVDLEATPFPQEAGVGIPNTTIVYRLRK